MSVSFFMIEGSKKKNSGPGSLFICVFSLSCRVTSARWLSEELGLKAKTDSPSLCDPRELGLCASVSPSSKVLVLIPPVDVGNHSEKETQTIVLGSL